MTCQTESNALIRASALLGAISFDMLRVFVPEPALIRVLRYDFPCDAALQTKSANNASRETARH
ncbi:hypothetical protein GCWU000341_00523 [Oribacterium sp. oral taxon 078 str. F0262]|nr:hypothetical protein GCWU000341_00523 [Oribacterium sp. oral taxon 078 str. F0262]